MSRFATNSAAADAVSSCWVKNRAKACEASLAVVDSARTDSATRAASEVSALATDSKVVPVVARTALATSTAVLVSAVVAELPVPIASDADPDSDVLTTLVLVAELLSVDAEDSAADPANIALLAILSVALAASLPTASVVLLAAVVSPAPAASTAICVVVTVLDVVSAAVVVSETLVLPGTLLLEVSVAMADSVRDPAVLYVPVPVSEAVSSSARVAALEVAPFTTSFAELPSVTTATALMTVASVLSNAVTDSDTPGRREENAKSAALPDGGVYAVPVNAKSAALPAGGVYDISGRSCAQDQIVLGGACYIIKADHIDLARIGQVECVASGC